MLVSVVTLLTVTLFGQRPRKMDMASGLPKPDRVPFGAKRAKKAKDTAEILAVGCFPQDCNFYPYGRVCFSSFFLIFGDLLPQNDEEPARKGKEKIVRPTPKAIGDRSFFWLLCCGPFPLQSVGQTLQDTCCGKEQTQSQISSLGNAAPSVRRRTD